MTAWGAVGATEDELYGNAVDGMGERSFGATASPEMAEYLRQLEGVMERLAEGGGFENPEAQALFVENAMAEVKGSEVRLATDHYCSHVMERLLQLATPLQAAAYMTAVVSGGRAAASNKDRNPGRLSVKRDDGANNDEGSGGEMGRAREMRIDADGEYALSDGEGDAPEGAGGAAFGVDDSDGEDGMDVDGESDSFLLRKALTNCYASHVFETALGNVNFCLTQGQGVGDGLVRRLRGELHKIVEGVAAGLADAEGGAFLLTNKYASHTMRHLLTVVSGRDMAASGNLSRMRGSASVGFQRKSTRGPSRARSFLELLPVLVGAIVDAVGVADLRRLRTHSAAGPLIVALLQASQGQSDLMKVLVDSIVGDLDAEHGDDEGDGGYVGGAMDKARSDRDVSERGVSTVSGAPAFAAHASTAKDGAQARTAPLRGLDRLVHHDVGSLVAEAVLRTAPEDVFHSLYLRHFRGKLGALGAHPTANYVVQALILSVSEEGEARMIADELRGEVRSLMEGGRAGVVLAMCHMSGAFLQDKGKRDMVRAVAHALDAAVQPESKQLVEKLLLFAPAATAQTGSRKKKKQKKPWAPTRVEREALSAEQERARMGTDEDGFSLLGSLIAQALIAYPPSSAQLVHDSMASLEGDLAERMAKSSGGSRVLEAFLACGAPDKQKRRVMRLFKGRWATLASHKYGSHVVEKCYALSGVVEKEAIAAELIENERVVLASTYGVHVARRCSLSTYKKATGFGAARESAMEEWRAKERRAEGRKGMFEEILNADAAAILDARLQGKAGEHIRRLADQLTNNRTKDSMSDDEEYGELDKDLLDEKQLAKLGKSDNETQKSKRGIRHAAKKRKTAGDVPDEDERREIEDRGQEVERMFSMKKKSLARIREELENRGGGEIGRGDIRGIAVDVEDEPVDLANAPKDVINILKVIEATTKGGIKKQRKERKEREGAQ